MDFSDQWLDLSSPQVMGILNASPDSFYKHSHVNRMDDALARVEAMIVSGASMIDVGGEATNPALAGKGAVVSEAQECERVVPLIEAIGARFDVIISVDTSKAAVMQAAVNAGARMINDQQALQQPGALDAAISLDVPVCLMHRFMPSEQETNANAELAHTLQRIKNWLGRRARTCMERGLKPSKIILDPGFGHGCFGKSTRENIYVLKHLALLTTFSFPLLVGVSRKTFIGEVTGQQVEHRLPGSIAAACIAVLNGASIIRVHDVFETKQALAMINACQCIENSECVE